MLSYQNCTLCPRRCGADRTNGQLGFCRQPDKIYAARAAAHYWEEPVISGSFGSGAVFFSGCTLKCLFCQNGVISQENLGKESYVPRPTMSRSQRQQSQKCTAR